MKNIIEKITLLSKKERTKFIKILCNKEEATTFSYTILPDIYKASPKDIHILENKNVFSYTKEAVSHLHTAFNLAIYLFTRQDRFTTFNQYNELSCFTTLQIEDLHIPLEQLVLPRPYVSPDNPFPLSLHPAYLKHTVREKHPVSIGYFFHEMGYNIQRNISLEFYLQAYVRDEKIYTKIHYNGSKYSMQLTENFLHIVNSLYLAIVSDKRSELIDFLVTPKKYEEKLLLWGQGERYNISQESIIPTIESHLKDSKKRIAIQTEEETVTYHTLFEWVKTYTQQLLEKGVEKGDKICVYRERDPHTIALILAILRLGCTYIPINKNKSISQVKYIWESASAKYILTTLETAHKSKEFGLPFLSLHNEIPKKRKQELSLPRISGKDIAYIIYTSGTTQKPKAVQISHQALLYSTSAISKAYEITHLDRILQFAPFDFDVSIFELFATFYNNAILCLIEERAKNNPKKIASFFQDINVTVAEIPPILLPLLEPYIKFFDRLRLLSLGGEKFLMKHVTPWLSPTRKVINGYGPTETTVAVTTYECKNSFEPMPPIGRPLSNVEVYNLSPKGTLVPIGSVGELHIGGPFLSEGYLNKQFNKKAFSIGKMPNAPSLRLYNTGDVCRWRGDGNLEIFGRTDRQIKIRGYRIEPAQIERQAIALVQIKQAVVMQYKEKEEKDPFLVLFYVLEKGTSLKKEDIQNHMLKKLPHYMIPSLSFSIPEIKKTTSQKVDYTYLQNYIKDKKMTFSVKKNLPSCHTSKALADIISNALPSFDMKEKTNFFQKGANSLSAARIVSGINKKFNIQLEVPHLYKNPTLEKLKIIIKKKVSQQDNKIRLNDLLQYIKEPWYITLRKAINNTENTPSIFYFHCAGGSPYDALSWADLCSPEYNFYSVQIPGHGHRVEEEALESASFIGDTLSDEILALNKGKVVLIGHSMGGLLAFETAKKIDLKNKNKIQALIPIASRPPHIQPSYRISHLEDDKAFWDALQQFRYNSERKSKKEIKPFNISSDMLQTLRADCTLSETYLHTSDEKVSVPIIACYGEKDPFVDEKLTLEWKTFTSSDFTIQPFNTGHFVIEDGKNVFLTFLNKMLYF